jgi:hypothetical protein
MPVVFDEIVGNVQSSEPPEANEPEQPAGPAASEVATDALKRAMCQLRQRQARLWAS